MNCRIPERATGREAEPESEAGLDRVPDSLGETAPVVCAHWETERHDGKTRCSACKRQLYL